MKVGVRDSSCALISVVPTFYRLKIARSGRRRRFNESAVRNAYPFRKPDSWLKPRCRLISEGKSYADAASARKEMDIVECQTSLMWGFSERLPKTAPSSVRSCGGLGSVSAGSQASSGRSRPVSADDRVPCDPAKSSETVKGLADTSKTASKGSAVPSKTGPKGSARPLKTASSKDDSSSSRSSPTAVRVGRVLVDVEVFVHSRRSAPSGGTQAPLKPAGSDRLKKAEQYLVFSNQYSVLSDDEMDSSSIPPE